MEKEFRNYIEAEKNIKSYCKAIERIASDYGQKVSAKLTKPDYCLWEVVVTDELDGEILFSYRSSNPDTVSIITYTWFDGYRIGLRPF